MYLDQLDALDQKILSLLIENARYSYSEIGERVGISRVAVKARIDALEKKRIIEEYTTIINPQKISGAISCYFEIEADPACLQEIVQRLYHNETVTQIYRMTGPCCLHVHAVASSQEDLERLLRQEIDCLPGVRQVSSRVILSRIKDVKGLRL
ncbi:MAG TPA: Lrp/AsnC family transcriptional regulator [Candidatus Fimivicinus intestinavium]|nr:Lrp/AsnC family transcriptional regulator [Candidatus Fimivicinus intestinavium]